MFTVKNKKDCVPASSFLRKHPSWWGMGGLGTYTNWLHDHLPEWIYDELSWEIPMFKCLRTVLIWNSNDHSRSKLWIFNGYCASWVVLRYQLELVKFIQDRISMQGVRDGQRREFKSWVAYIYLGKTVQNSKCKPAASGLSFRIMFQSQGKEVPAKGVLG